MHLKISFVSDWTKNVIFRAFFAAVLFSGTASGLQTPDSGIDEMLGKTIPPNLSFFDEQGQKVLMRELTDRPSVLTFVYFGCQSRCPLLLGNLAQTLEKTGLSPEDYRVITISFDETDTPVVAARIKRNYIKAAGPHFPETSWRFLTAEKKTIDRVTASVGFRFSRESGGFSHPRALVFLSPRGDVSRYLYGMSFSGFDVGMGLKEAAAGSGIFSVRRLPLLCFCFDHEENRYVFSLARALSAVAFALIVTSIVLLPILRKRGKRA